MPSRKRAQLCAIVDSHFGERGLDEFEPEQNRSTVPEDGTSWLRVDAVPSPAAVPATASHAHPLAPVIAIPVILAATFAGAVLSWSALGDAGVAPAVLPRDVVRSSESVVSPPSVPAPSDREPAARVEAPTPATAPAPAQAQAPAPTPTPAPDAAAPPAPLDPDLGRTLSTLSEAYRSLDAASVATVWPGADVAMLTETFSGLKYQSLTFDRCRVREQTGGSAVASCDVSLAMAAKSGDESLQRRRESWTLVFERTGGRPIVTGVSVR